jgi:predicted nucleic acid-binding protein
VEKLFLDTNILIDVMAKREPHHENAIRILLLAHQGKVKLYCSAISISTCDYVLRKQLSKAESLKAIRSLLELIEVIPTSHKAVIMATKSRFSDLEDAIQHYTAIEFAGIDCIITRNVIDYRHSLLPVRDTW